MSPLALLLGVSLGLAQAQSPPTERNLLPNSSFETIEGGQPSAWQWSTSGNAKASFAVDGRVAHSGQRSIRIANQSPFGPHVFGRLATPLRLNAGRTYTLSCFVKSPQPGTAWIGTGRGWQFRFHFLPAPEWTRVTGTFEADSDALEVMVATESPTAGLWVDDVQLEPGVRATSYVYDPPVQAGKANMRLFQGEAVWQAPNLVGNSGFETLDGGLPKGWAFDHRNTDATMAVDETVSHSGTRSLKLTNHTEFGAHVYALLTYLGGVPVEPDSTYTLSYFARSDKPGIAWLGGGPEWRVRCMAPPTEGQWQRVSQTFSTGPDERAWTLLLATESPTEGFWVDDVKLERGGEPTLYVPEEGARSQQVMLDLPANVAAGRVLRLGGWVHSPQTVAGGRLAFELTDADGRPLASATWEGELAAGPAYAELRYGIGAREAGACTLRLTVSDGDRVLAASADSFTLHTVEHERARLAATRRAVARVRKLYDQVRARGIDGAYPLVSLTVAGSFCDFVAEDLGRVEVVRARRQIDEMDEMLLRAEGELRALATGGRRELPVPRYVTGPPRIDGTAFLGTVEWPDGRREERPVFFTGYGHFNSVRRDVEKFPAYGLNIFQVELGPSSTLPSENEENLAPVEDFEALLAQAEKSNVAVNLLLSPHYMPQWVFEKWPAVGGVNGGFARFAVDAPEVRSVLERHLRLTATRLKGRPGLHSYCLSNEPIYLDARSDPNNQAKWVAYLKAKYADLAALNQAHRAQYASFEEVPLSAPSPQATPLYYDWCRFNNQRFADFHRWMADVIHQVDPAIPVHAKIMNTVFYRDCTAWGVDPELFCDLSQINGNDCAKMVNHAKGTWANSWQGENMYFDLLRSCKPQPIFNSENHVITDRDLDFVPAVHIRNLIWQSAVHGEGASTMWVWERTFDRGSDLAGSIMHRPACAEDHGRTALDLMRLAPEVTALQKAPARLALVYSIASLIYNPGYQDMLSRVYQALNFTGEKIDFVTERQLAMGKAAQYDAIIAPAVTHLPPDALQGLRDFDRLPGRPGLPSRLILTAGEGCLTRDDLDRECPAQAFAHLLPLPDLREAALRDAVAGLLADHGWPRGVVVRDATTGEEAWGVEWLSAETPDGLLLNLVNYTQQPLEVRVDGLPGEAANLITGSTVEGALVLAPLEPVLLRARG